MSNDNGGEAKMNRRKLIAGAGAAVLGGVALGSNRASAHAESGDYQMFLFRGSEAVQLGNDVTVPKGGFCPNFEHNGNPYKVAFWYAGPRNTDYYTYTVRRETDVYFNDCCFDEFPSGAIPLGGYTQDNDGYCTAYYLDP